jgi:hypothetical protein
MEKKTLDYKNLNLGTRMRFVTCILKDKEIGLKTRLGNLTEVDDERWERVRNQLRNEASILLRRHRERRTQQE